MNTGTKVKLDFVKLINYKKYSDLNPNLRAFIKFIFNDILQWKRLNTRVKQKSSIQIELMTSFILIF